MSKATELIEALKEADLNKLNAGDIVTLSGKKVKYETKFTNPYKEGDIFVFKSLDDKYTYEYSGKVGKLIEVEPY